MFNIYLTNLADYNAGYLHGNWVSLPADLTEELTKIGCIDEESGEYINEHFITDYENDYGYNVSEYENIEELNELAEQLEALNEDQQEHLKAYMEATGYSLKESLDKYEDSIYYSGMTLLDVAYEIVEECYDLPEIAQRYFDYEAFARDLGFDGYTETEDGTICIQ